MLAAAHLLAIGAFAPPSRVALAAVVPTRATLPACASSAEASMRKIVVGYALASAALCTSAVQADTLGAAVRLSSAGAAALDFAPTAANQLASSAAALDNPGPLSMRWALLVRGKVLAEFSGLALMLAGRGTARACAAVGVTMCGHLAFWLLGAADVRHDDAGDPAPVPPAVARTIGTADAALLVAALLGAFAPARRVQKAGATVTALALATISLEAAVSKLRARLAPPSGA